jgi:hypothetical protein
MVKTSAKSKPAKKHDHGDSDSSYCYDSSTSSCKSALADSTNLSLSNSKKIITTSPAQARAFVAWKVSTDDDADDKKSPTNPISTLKNILIMNLDMHMFRLL